MMLWLFAYLAALVVVGALDALWLGVIARDLYRTELAAVMVEPIRKLPAALFYFGYPIGVLALALHPLPPTWTTAVARAALVGFVAYATYDLTNLATLKAWSWKLAAIDIAWGTVLSAAAGAAAYAVRK
jgi:uncharacterized membrane protein